MADLVEIDGLVARRGDFALSVDDWAVAPGCVVGVVGANGAGKTTLLDTIVGLRAQDAGTVRVLGHDPWSEPVEVRQQLGYMSDDLPLFEMSIDRLLWTLSGYYASWSGSLVDTLMTRFALDGTKRVSALSKGEGTRLRLIVAIAHQPRLVVLDEPATGLDPIGRRALLETVLDVVRDPSRSVIISSHLLADVERIADRLLILRHGAVVEAGPIDALVEDGRSLEEAFLAWENAG